MFRYRVYSEDGDELGEAAYVSRIKPDETIWLSGARPVRVIDVVELEPGGCVRGATQSPVGRATG